MPRQENDVRASRLRWECLLDNKKELKKIQRKRKTSTKWKKGVCHWMGGKDTKEQESERYKENNRSKVTTSDRESV